MSKRNGRGRREMHFGTAWLRERHLGGDAMQRMHVKGAAVLG